MTDQPLTLELGERADRLGVGDLRVGGMELVELDCLDSEPLDRKFALLAQVDRVAVGVPFVRPAAGKATLRGDHQPLRVRRKRLADQVLVGLRAIRVRGIDEVDVELDGLAQHGHRVLVVGVGAPDALAGETHGAVAQAIDLEVGADPDLSRAGCSAHSSSLDLENRQVAVELPLGHLDPVVLPLPALDLDETVEHVLPEGAQDQL